MSNLLLFNLATDADDPLLGFTTLWINRLAEHYERIDVITMRAGRLTVAANVRVYSVGKEKGYGNVRRTFEFYRILARLRRERPYGACFAHMMPLFAVMGAPLLMGIPIVVWYTHRQRHRTLEWAERVSSRVVTAASDSFPIPSDKVRVLGHGIDTEFFSPPHLRPLPDFSEGKKAAPDSAPAPTRELTDGEGKSGAPPCASMKRSIVQVARLMPIKQQAALIRALVDLPEARAIFVGDVPPETDVGYRAELEALARDLGVADRVTFAGNQPSAAVRDFYRQASAAVNLSPAGLFDKAALESMAMEVPTLVISPAFCPSLGKYADWLLIDPPESLTARLSRILALSQAERQAMGAELRANVVAQHSLDQLIARLVSVLNTGEPA